VFGTGFTEIDPHIDQSRREYRAVAIDDLGIGRTATIEDIRAHGHDRGAVGQHPA
jgi:hypothetical protein